MPSWENTKTQSKKGFDKAWGWLDKLGAPVNRLSNRVGSEAFWPTTLDKESDKAARILQSFCKDGFYQEEERPGTADRPNEKTKQRVIKKIPQKVIENAVGLAIFTTMRTGLWLSGAGGSGVLVARTEDGSWSPPSGIMLHTAGLGFLVGIDIYDCVLVINNRKTLDSFTKVRATLGGEVSAVAGPVGMGGVLENDGKWKQANRPVFTYLKSRGFYAGVQMDGTIIIERNDENERFYGEKIGVVDILAGKARHPPPEIKKLMETLKAAEGRSDYDEKAVEEVAEVPAPSDFNIEKPHERTFGIPEASDPDPFGVQALHNEGYDIVTAGDRSRPSIEEFVFHPSPNSPIYAKYRQSLEASEAASSQDADEHNQQNPYGPERRPSSQYDRDDWDDDAAEINYQWRNDKSANGNGNANTNGDSNGVKSPDLRGYDEVDLWDEPTPFGGEYNEEPRTVPSPPAASASAARGPPPPLPPRQLTTPAAS
jgi:lipid-binding SYLF domain-containing protein